MADGERRLTPDPDHEARTRRALRTALASVPFYAKQDLASRVTDDAPLAEVLARLPLLTRDAVRPTLPKAWFPEGHDARAALASGEVSVVEAGPSEGRVRILFDAALWREQERRALSIHPRAASALSGELGPYRDAVLWTPERGTGSCGAGDPSYEDRLEGTRLHLNSRQDPTFWTDAVMARMLDELAHHETVALLTDPFYLDALARHAASVGRRLDVRGFVATMRARATRAHRAALSEVYSGPVVDAYGAREVGMLFVEAEDEKMHHAPFSTHVELLRARVETPGAKDVALVVVTTLDRQVQPLVRYVLGDLVGIAAGESRFTTVPPILSVEGTVHGTIVRPDGALVTEGAIDRAIATRARGYRVVQSEPGTVEVEVVAGALAQVEEALAPLFTGMKIKAREASAIGVEPNGKIRTSERRVPLGLSEAFEGCEGAL